MLIPQLKLQLRSFAGQPMAGVAPPPRIVRAPRTAKKPAPRGKLDPFTESGKTEIVKRIREAAVPHWMQPGTWHSPILSHRQYAVLRKRHPELELPTRMLRPRSAGAPPLREKKIKPPKLHKYDRAEYREKRFVLRDPLP